MVEVLIYVAIGGPISLVLYFLFKPHNEPIEPPLVTATPQRIQNKGSIIGSLRTCLIVDGQIYHLAQNKAILEAFGFRVIEAKTSQQAIQICRNEMPRVILVDERAGGAELIKSLRNLPNGNGPRIFFCTQEITVSQIAEAHRAGADEYFAYPLDEAQVDAKLREVAVIE